MHQSYGIHGLFDSSRLNIVSKYGAKRRMEKSTYTTHLHAGKNTGDEEMTNRSNIRPKKWALWERREFTASYGPFCFDMRLLPSHHRRDRDHHPVLQPVCAFGVLRHLRYLVPFLATREVPHLSLIHI